LKYKAEQPIKTKYYLKSQKAILNLRFISHLINCATGPPKRNFLGSRSPSQSDLRKTLGTDTQKLEQEIMELKIVNQDLHDRCNEYMKQLAHPPGVFFSSSLSFLFFFFFCFFCFTSWRREEVVLRTRKLGIEYCQPRIA
jgi:hypothetical protein